MLNDDVVVVEVDVVAPSRKVAEFEGHFEEDRWRGDSGRRWGKR